RRPRPRKGGPRGAREASRGILRGSDRGNQSVDAAGQGPNRRATRRRAQGSWYLTAPRSPISSGRPYPTRAGFWWSDVAGRRRCRTASGRRTADEVVQHPSGPPRTVASAKGSGNRTVSPEVVARTPPRRVPAAGEFHRAMDRDSSGGARVVPPGRSASTADPSSPPREEARDAGPPILPNGGLQPAAQPQGEHGSRSSLVRETRGVRAADDRDGRRAMGDRSRLRGEPRGSQDDDLLGSS